MGQLLSIIFFLVLKHFFQNIFEKLKRAYVSFYNYSETFYVKNAKWCLRNTKLQEMISKGQKILPWNFWTSDPHPPLFLCGSSPLSPIVQKESECVLQRGLPQARLQDFSFHLLLQIAKCLSVDWWQSGYQEERPHSSGNAGWVCHTIPGERARIGEIELMHQCCWYCYSISLHLFLLSSTVIVFSHQLVWLIFRLC